jgi:hypothetical protein
VSEASGQLEYPEEEERPPLKAGTRGLVKIQQTMKI